MQFLQKLFRALTGKKVLKLVAVCLAVFMFLQIPASLLNVTEVNAVTQSDIDAQKSKLDELTTKKKTLNSKIESLEAQQASTLAKKELLDEQISLTQQQIDTTNEQIEQYIGMIAEKELEVKDLEKKEAKQLELYKERVRSMEEKGSISYYSILFGASSFSDLLARLDFIHEIMEYDEDIYNQLIMAREATQKAKEQLETAKAELDDTKAELETLKAELDRQSAELENVITELESNISEYAKLEDAAEKEADNVQAKINELTKELEDQKKAEEEAAKSEDGGNGGGGYNPVSSSDGSYIWPTASRNITSRYGLRLHPILGYYRMHTGVDIGGGGGNDVLAIASGTVIIVAYDKNGYGNYVVIDHGGSTSLYAHMRTVYVEQGQQVNQGTRVGLVGSTGLSSGNHLHFEISINGSRVDPLTQYDSSQWVKCWDESKFK